MLWVRFAFTVHFHARLKPDAPTLCGWLGGKLSVAETYDAIPGGVQMCKRCNELLQFSLQVPGSDRTH